MDKYLGKMVEFQGDFCIQTYFSGPGKNIRHGLLIIPEIWGINDHIKEMADSFARQGFAVIVPDIYSFATVRGELSASEITSMLELASRLDHGRLAELGYLEKEVKELPEKKRKDVERVLRVFRDGKISHKLYSEILRTEKYFFTSLFDDTVEKIRFMAVLPVGTYPSLLSAEYLSYIKKSQKTVYRTEALGKILKRQNPVDPKLLGLLSRGEEKLYCIKPFTNIDIYIQGIRCCCWMADLANLNTVPLDEADSVIQAWKSDAFENVREAVRDGTYRYCKLSYCAEVRGDRKNLLNIAELRESYPAIADYIEGKDRRYRGMPENGIISADTTCNLGCPSCSRFILPNLPCEVREKIIGTLKAAGRDLKIIHLADMGEVFFSPVYLGWIMNFRREDYPALEKINIITNGLKVTPDLWSRLPAEFKKLIHTVIVSIDGATKATYEENRRGGNFDVLLENLGFIKTLRDRGDIKHLRICFAYQANNYSEMPEMVDLARRYSFDEVYFERLMDWRSYEAGEYRRRDVGNPEHPGYGSFEAVRETVLEYKRKKIISKITLLA